MAHVNAGFLWAKNVICHGKISQVAGVPQGEKIRKRTMREREAKLEKYNRPKGERKRREHSPKRGLGNQRSTGTADREIKSLSEPEFVF
jgi:hypothetical protein